MHEPIEPTSLVRDLDADTPLGSGFSGGPHGKWVCAGSVRRKSTGTFLAFRASLEEMVRQWEPDEFCTGEFLGCNPIFQEVTLRAQDCGGAWGC